MNIIDIIILVLLAASVVWGLYRGFIQSALNTVGCLAALLLAGSIGPRLAEILYANQSISDMLATYTDAVSRVGDYQLATSKVQNIGENVIQTILQNVSLPESIASILRSNLVTQAYASSGLSTVNEYVSSTIVTSAVQVLCFLVCFAAAYMVLSILIALLQHVFHFPLLKQFDWLAGGLFGLARGVFIVYLLFLLVPLLSTMIPLEGFDAVFVDSTFTPLFQNSDFFARVVKGLY